MGFKSIALAATTLVLSTSVNASVIYTYTGNNFEQIQGVVYSTSNSVSASIQLANALAPLSAATAASVESFIITDGVNTLTDDNSNFSLEIYTDALGDIYEWRISATVGFDQPTYIGDASWDILTVGKYNTTINVSDSGRIGTCMGVNETGGCSNAVGTSSGEIIGNQGSWAITGAPISPVPVPAAVWLFGSGLIGLIGVARRKA